jgi:hypothetical protein
MPGSDATLVRKSTQRVLAGARAYGGDSERGDAHAGGTACALRMSTDRGGCLLKYSTPDVAHPQDVPGPGDTSMSSRVGASLCLVVYSSTVFGSCVHSAIVRDTSMGK